MRAKLHAYQEYSIARILDNDRTGLFLDMGMGKTLTVLTAFSDLQSLSLAKKALIVSTKRIAGQVWPTEINKWDQLSHLTCAVAVGNVDERHRALAAGADITTINFEALVSTLSEYKPRQLPFDTLIIDESSGFKNPSSKRFRFLRRYLSAFDRRIIMTGTPAPKNYMDLWAQVYILDQGEALGKTLTEYRRRYFKPGKHNGHIVYEWLLRDGAEADIMRALEPLAISMKASDYLQLPDRVDNHVKLKLPTSAERGYKAFMRDRVLELGEADIIAANAAVLTGKLTQYTSGAVYEDDGQSYRTIHDEKLQALAEVVDDLQGQSLIVFYQFRHELERIQQRFPEAKTLDEISGISAWNNGEVPILLLHPQSAGHGLNLQGGGHNICWFSLPWSLELYAQGNARLHRQGQKYPVIVHHLIASGTIDERIVEVLAGRHAMQEALLEHVKVEVK